MKENPTYVIPTAESETVEFKSSFQDEVIITLVAFANAKGGSVYVGVGDKGDIKAVSLGKETIQNWVNEIKIKTQPSLIPDVETLEVEGKTIVLLKMQEYPIKPVSIKGKCYKRIGNSNHLMGVEEIANEHLKTINGSWDFYPDPHHSLKDISLEKVSRFIHRIEQRTENKIPYTPVEFLTKMEMLREGKLTFGAYLLFVTDYCLVSDVQVGRFKSNITIIDSISLNTDLFSEVEEIIAFIKKHLMVEYIITGEPQRTERFDYPLDAIREIVINMIVHRDYRDSSGSVIKIFDNRIEFYNPGKLFGGITIEDLLTGNYSSKSRNKLIAKAFKEVGLIERYGSGIHRVQEICKDYGVVAPVFEEFSGGFRVVLFNEKQGIQKDDTIKGGLSGGLSGGLNGGLKDADRFLLSLIEKNPGIQLKEILSVVENKSQRTLERQIARLVERKLIERRGSRKTGGYWKVNKEVQS